MGFRIDFKSKFVTVKLGVLKKAKNQYESSYYRVFLPWEIGLSSEQSIVYLDLENNATTKSADANSAPADFANIQRESALNINLKTLSKEAKNPESIVELFYQKIGHSRISNQKRERAIQDIKELQKEGFSIEDIAFAAEWSVKNVKEPPYDFSIIKHTIGQALSEKEKILEQQALEEKREKERQEELEKRRLEEEENEKLDEYIAKLPLAEKEALESQARDELIRKEKIAERYINSMVLGAKVKEIVKKEGLIKLG